MIETEYLWTDGKILEVREGIGGDSYMTMYQKPNKISWKRFVRSELPVRVTRNEGQADLDAFAKRHNLQVRANERLQRTPGVAAEPNR